ncbi:MAG: MFS transporter [Planctomycetales bacterium]|nr:MFS transporter [Planctomycetales bacterium]
MPPHPKQAARLAWFDTGAGVLVRVSIMMALQWASLGAWIVTLPTYLAANTGDEGSGVFGASFIGDIGVAGAIGALLSPLVCGLLVDKWLNTEQVLAILHALSAALLLLVGYAQSQAVFFLLLLGYFQVYAPSGALLSSLALHCLPDSDKSFSVTRAMGTVGWILAGALVGLWPVLTGGQSIEGTIVPMRIGFVLHVIAALVAITLPATPPTPTMTESQAAPHEGLWRNKAVLFFLAISVIAASPVKFYESFVNKYLNHFEYPFPAFVLTLGQVSEVLIMLCVPLLLVRFRLKNLFLAGLIAWAIRFALLGFANQGSRPWMVYTAISLHGPCFVLVSILGQLYVDRLAPKNLRASAQGAFLMATFGVGSLVGARLSGWAQSQWLTPAGVSPAPYHWQYFWLLPCGMSLAAAVLFAVVFRESPHAVRPRNPEA